ncbi:MAG: cytochrome c biogenesis protein CcdA [Lachnospiraceae bacterium]|jgi:cytochrome c-type biogenesis protein|nr:cytochrome c biogenesis protein CcdA [Lachnospiraceae bacterium]
MQYILSLLEGIITFISPCLLPMLPVYLSFFAGGSGGEKTNSTLKNAIGFVCGFTVVFLILGAFAGSIGLFLRQYTSVVNIITGLIVILFGLNFLGLIQIDLLNRTYRKELHIKEMGFFSSVLFGIVFSIGWTPCVGAFLGSALMLASQQGSAIEGMLMLLFYSMGLGIPFIISAVLIHRLKTAFQWIKAHYRIINLLSGGLLVIVGILMMTGWMGYFLTWLTF